MAGAVAAAGAGGLALMERRCKRMIMIGMRNSWDKVWSLQTTSKYVMELRQANREMKQ